MSLFADYKFEREGKHLIENDHGFAVYSFNKEVCYIEDIYVKPDDRKTGAAREMADWISNLAKGRGCKRLMGSVSPSANSSHASLLVLVAYGMTLHSSQYDMVYFSKEL